jgi:6-phosphogluconolactonase
MLKPLTLFLFLSLLFVSNLSAQQNETYHLLIGTYTTEGKPNGIHVYRFNVQTGDFQVAQPVTELNNASYLAISEDRQNVYAISEGRGGGVNAYTFDPLTGALKFINKVPAAGPAYVSVDRNKKIVVTANYGGGSITAVHLNADGSLAEDNVQTVQHEGSSVVKERQDKPHVHSVVFSPDERYLLAPDLGTDRVYQYRVSTTEKQMLTPADPPFAPAKPGGGPRHLSFHPNGKYAYVVLEIEGAVTMFDYHDGKLEAKQTVSMMAPGFTGKVGAADIHISPDGKFLYASNRGDADEITIYSIGKNGMLKTIGRQSVLGKNPRNFVIDPTGNFLLAANQTSNDIIIFKRNQKTGLLTPTGKKIEIEKPVCLKFVAVGK